MLLPALNQARERARSISCTSNLKQIGFAFTQYTMNNDDYMFTASYDSDRTDDWKFWFLHILREMKGDVSTTITHTRDKVLYCPTSELTKNANYNNITYGYNQWLSYWRSANPKVDVSGGGMRVATKIGSVKHPSKVIAFGDSDGDLYYDEWVDGKEYLPGSRHSMSGNFAHVDGHTANYRLAENVMVTPYSSVSAELCTRWGVRHATSYGGKKDWLTQ
ncbi:MAG: DUF1559 domain-containing protein [Victivallales bacterium]|nr:DUF1559 domain-containing protein [Victivallales bacterium]